MISPLRDTILYNYNPHSQSKFDIAFVKSLNIFLNNWETSYLKLEVNEIHDCQNLKIYEEPIVVQEELKKVFKLEPFYFLFNKN